MSPRPVRRSGVGVVGTGFAARAHLEALRRIPDVEVVAVAGSDPARTRALAAGHGARAHAGAAALLEDPAVEAVHVCAVDRLHYEVSLAALESGRHVLSEKPLAVNGEQSAALAAAAERASAADVASGVCFTYRHYPLVAHVRELLASGAHGPPHFVHGAYLQDWMLLEEDWNWRLEAGEDGGSRAVADIGSHWLDLAQHVTGDAVAEVLADVATVHATRLRPRDAGAAFSAGSGPVERVPVVTEDFGAVLLRFASGLRGSFAVSQVSAGCKNALRLQVDARSAAVVWEQERPDRAWVGRRGAPNLEVVRDAAVLHPRAARLARLPGGHPEGWADALANLIADFHAGVAARHRGEPPDSDVATFRDGHAVVRIVEEIMASARERRWVTVGSDAPGADQ